MPRVLGDLEVFDCEFTCRRLSFDICCSMPRAELMFDCAKMDGAVSGKLVESKVVRGVTDEAGWDDCPFSP